MNFTALNLMTRRALQFTKLTRESRDNALFVVMLLILLAIQAYGWVSLNAINSGTANPVAERSERAIDS